MRFSGVKLAPVTPDKTDRSVRILSTVISFGACGYDLLIKKIALVTFFVLIYSLVNVFLQVIGPTNFSSASFFLSLVDAGSLGDSSSSLAIFFSLFSVTD